MLIVFVIITRKEADMYLTVLYSNLSMLIVIQEKDYCVKCCYKLKGKVLPLK